MARKGLGSPFYKEDHIVFHLQLYVQQRQSPAYAFLQRESCSAPPALMPMNLTEMCMYSVACRQTHHEPGQELTQIKGDRERGSSKQHQQGYLNQHNT